MANCCIPFLILAGFTVVLVVQALGLIKLMGTDLCKIHHYSNEYCKDNYMYGGNDSVQSKEEATFDTCRGLIGFSLMIEICAYWVLCSRIYACVSACANVCHYTWDCCFECGNCWYPTMVVGVLFNLAGSLAMGIVVKHDDLFTYVDGFTFTLISMLIGIIVVICWAIFLCIHGCPDKELFLGSDTRGDQIQFRKERAV